VLDIERFCCECPATVHECRDGGAADVDRMPTARAGSATKLRSQSVIDNKSWRREEELLKSLASLLFPAALPEHRNQQNKPGCPRQVQLICKRFGCMTAQSIIEDMSPFFACRISPFRRSLGRSTCIAARLRRAALRRHPGTVAHNISKRRLDHHRRVLAPVTERPVVLPSAAAKGPV
jgi:hypothetical protein